MKDNFENLISGYFSVGTVIISKEVGEKVNFHELLRILRSHANCNWDNLAEEDQRLNLEAAKSHTGFVFSKYELNGVWYWIVTDFTSNITTVMTEEEGERLYKEKRDGFS
ncbi:hypothetical protein [Anaerolinea sp.]|uniref:hypothetical protein n=1 Tax=Anaerolinea sp. TaxID=1872519 RepID=UPI002ACD4A33|nr:hypothetical protein [Anaerolinea sp.]